MKKLLIGLTLLTSMSSFANTPTEYEFRYAGKIKMDKLAEEMSPGFSYAEVKINDIRKAAIEYNPLEMLLGSEFDRYIIKVTLNDTDNATCRLVNLLGEHRFMITRCTSKTAFVSHSGFIYYRDLGLRINNY